MVHVCTLVEKNHYNHILWLKIKKIYIKIPKFTFLTRIQILIFSIKKSTVHLIELNMFVIIMNTLILLHFYYFV